jgi:hypothetical protein
LHYVSIATEGLVSVKYMVMLWVLTILKQVFTLHCEGVWVCWDVPVELLPAINSVILKEKASADSYYLTMSKLLSRNCGGFDGVGVVGGGGGGSSSSSSRILMNCWMTYS